MIKSNNKKSQKRTKNGEVISDKMDKTVIVAVTRSKKHPKYHKRFYVVKKFKAHDEKNQYKAGDLVVIEECRPLSREKRWRVLKKISSKVK